MFEKKEGGVNKLALAYNSFDVTYLNNQIDKINSTLNKFTYNSEKIFLEAGGKLQQFYKESRQITESAAQISNTISDEILQKGIRDLEFSLNDISIYLSEESKKINGDKNELLSTYSKLSNIGSELDGFEKIVKRLRMLGISTKIESSRLSLEDAGFFALAENVDRLAGIISGKISVIKKKSDFLLEELKRTTTELELLEIKQRKQSEVILNTTIKSLSLFKQKSGELSADAEDISELSKGVTSNIGDVVASIQFHDITRQQMEHSCQVLNELKQTIKHQTDISESDESFWGSVYDVYELQSIQLKNTLNEFVRAVATIISSLDNIGENISSIISRTFGLICQKEGKNVSCLKIFEDELALVSEGLNKDIEIGVQLSESIKSIVSIVDDLSTYVSEIEEVGSEIEIIALNARVKAAHFGTNGSALGVLAESIQRLSLEAKQQTVSTAEILENIINGSRKLRSDLESKNEGSSQIKVSAAVQKINELLGSMKAVESNTNESVDELKENVGVLKSKIDVAKTGITIHEEAEQNIGDIINELVNTSDFIKNNFELQSNRKENTKNIFTKYTMQSERNIHEYFAERENAAFNLSAQSVSNDESFGDNIELF